MSPIHLWLSQNEEYIEAHERLRSEKKARSVFLLRVGYAPSDPEEREELRLLSAKCQEARVAIRVLREKLMAAHSVEGEK